MNKNASSEAPTNEPTFQREKFGSVFFCGIISKLSYRSCETWIPNFPGRKKEQQKTPFGTFPKGQSCVFKSVKSS